MSDRTEELRRDRGRKDLRGVRVLVICEVAPWCRSSNKERPPTSNKESAPRAILRLCLCLSALV